MASKSVAPRHSNSNKKRKCSDDQNDNKTEGEESKILSVIPRRSHSLFRQFKAYLNQIKMCKDPKKVLAGQRTVEKFLKAMAMRNLKLETMVESKVGVTLQEFLDSCKKSTLLSPFKDMIQRKLDELKSEVKVRLFGIDTSLNDADLVEMTPDEGGQISDSVLSEDERNFPEMFAPRPEPESSVPTKEPAQAAVAAQQPAGKRDSDEEDDKKPSQDADKPAKERKRRRRRRKPRREADPAEVQASREDPGKKDETGKEPPTDAKQSEDTLKAAGEAGKGQDAGKPESGAAVPAQTGDVAPAAPAAKESGNNNEEASESEESEEEIIEDNIELKTYARDATMMISVCQELSFLLEKVPTCDHMLVYGGNTGEGEEDSAAPGTGGTGT